MKNFVLVALVTIVAAGCGKPGKRTAVGAGAGAAAGAIAGAVIGHQSGDRDKGALIGAGAGAALGGAIGNRMDKQAQELAAVAETRRTDEGIVTTLKSQLLFNTNSAELSSEANGNLNQIAEILKKYPENRLTVVGHADSTGAAAFNRTLSENRARSVASRLVARGVPQASVTSVGLGSSEPVASNDTADGRAKNRRVELQIVPDESKAK